MIKMYNQMTEEEWEVRIGLNEKPKIPPLDNKLVVMYINNPNLLDFMKGHTDWDYLSPSGIRVSGIYSHDHRPKEGYPDYTVEELIELSKTHPNKKVRTCLDSGHYSNSYLKVKNIRVEFIITEHEVPEDDL